LNAVSYIGAPLLDDDSVVGHLAALDTKPMPLEPDMEALFRIFAARAGAELRRIRAESDARRYSAQAAYLRQEVSSEYREMLGQSRPMLLLQDAIRQVAPSGATVLIQGETGTGKELIARAIHAASPRAAKPLIKVNCAAVPSALMESEFFGHERGAFIGALQRREGRFGLAHEGTIFLDEIGDLPLDLQAKLLRVLQEGEFESVGSSRTRRVDVRVIAATNRNLGDEAAAGRFRQDLFYRLNVFPLTAPPLRERAEDVGLLAESFARRFALKTGRKIALPLSSDCVRKLGSYEWPGNVRELQNVMERAVLTSRDGRLRPALAVTSSAPAVMREPPQVLTMAELRKLERANIVLALEQCGWRVSGAGGAAALLGMPPTTLASRMEALQIGRPAKAGNENS
jgi:transcriptional regulator with GAF, ATPase, and Fis domain